MGTEPGPGQKKTPPPPPAPQTNHPPPPPPTPTARAPPAAAMTITRPDRRNALSRDLIAALTEAFERARVDAEARCVVLTGAGPVFCSGMDLAELQESLGADPDQSPVWEDALRLATLYERIYA